MWPWIGFPIGVLAGLSTPVILPLALCLFLLISMALLIVLPRFRNGFVIEYRLFLFVLFGALYVHLRAGFESHNWQVEAGKTEYEIEARVVSPVWPERQANFHSVVVELHHIKTSAGIETVIIPSLAKVKLHFYRSINQQAEVLDLFKQGRFFKARAVLQPLHGFENGVGFNSVAFWRSKGVVAKGYVKSLLSLELWSEDTRQQKVMDSFYRHFSHLKHFDEIAALTLGQKQGISYTDKNRLNELGLSHLFAISGLHIAIIFGFVFFVCKWLLKLMSIPKLSPLLFSLFFIWQYIALIGVPISAMRAGLAITLVSLLFVKRIRMDWFKAVCLMMSCSLLIQPYFVLSPAWWLSFGAAIGIVVFAKLHPRDAGNLPIWGYFMDLFKLQVWIGLLMIPLTVYWFQAVYLAGFVTNLLAVPVFSLLLIPVCFVATVISFVNIDVALFLFKFVNTLIEWLWLVFSFIDSNAFTVSVSSQRSFYLVVLVVCFFAMYLSEKSRFHYYFATLLLAPIVISSVYPVKQSDSSDNLQLYVVDVGQGTAAILKLRESALLFDLGPAYNNQLSATDFVIKPLLIHLGISKIEGIWVSHFDSDHRGRLSAILDWPIAYLRFGCETKSVERSVFNEQFEIQYLWPYYPSEKQFNSKNDRSCVVKFTWQQHSILFPGDISRRVEKKLVELHNNEKIELKADIVLSPHHGSKTSSSKSFIEAVSPRYVIHTNGARNRFGFPHWNVSKRYEEAGVIQFQTAYSGLIRFDLNQEEPVVDGVALQLGIWTPFWKRQNPFSIREQIR